MTIKELLALEGEISSVEEFFSLLYNQSIDSSFSVFCSLNINYRVLEGVSVFYLECEGKDYFKLCFFNAPFLIYRVERDLEIKDCWLIDFELYKSALRSCVKAVDKKYLAVKNINEKIS